MKSSYEINNPSSSKRNSRNKFGGFSIFDAALLINSLEYRIWRQLIFISHFDISKVIKLLLYHYPGEHERTAVNQLCIKNSFTIFPGIQFLN